MKSSQRTFAKLSACTVAVAWALSVSALVAEIVPPLPLSAYCDSESSTNISFTTGNESARIFTLTLELDASVSNSVLVALGHDDDGNGVLAREETDALFGWDAGVWRYIDRRSGCEAATARPDGHRKLNWRLMLHSDKTAWLLDATDGDGVVFPLEVPRTLFDGSWNLMRVTACGLVAPSSLVVTDLKGLGYQVILR